MKITRGLTPSEMRMARTVFGAALNLAKVKIHNHPYMPFQGTGVAMTPNGEVWFRPEDYLADFSLRLNDGFWMVHELTHAWQYQSGRSTRLRGLLEQGSRFLREVYRYGALDPAKPFTAYLNEQRAAIVADYYLLLNGHAPRRGTGTLAAYRAVIPFAS